MRKKIKFFQVLAFYPFLFPVWQETFFRIEHCSFDAPIALTDEKFSEQRQFYLSIKEPLTRSRIIMSIAQCEKSDAMQQTLNAMLSAEKNPQLQADILKVLYQKGFKASNTPLLKELMKSEIPSVRAYAAALDIECSDSPFSALNMLEKEASEPTAAIVWNKLYEKRNLLDENTLSELINKIPPFQKPMLLKVLAAVSAEPENNKIIKDAAENGSMLEKISIAEALARRKNSADSILAKFAESSDRRLRMAAATAEAGDTRLPFLIKLSADKDCEVRRLAVISLARFGVENESAVTAIIERLDDEELLVRNESEKELIRLSIGENYLSLILENLRQKKGIPSSIYVLGRLNYQPAKEEIQAVMNSTEDKESRKRAIYAIGRLDYKNVAKDVAKFADANEPEIRRATAFALGCLAQKDTFHTLAKLAEDKDPETSAEALLGISKIADKFFLNISIASLKLVKESNLIRSAAAKALSAIGQNSDEAVKALRRAALEKTIPTELGPIFDMDNVRASAAFALTEIAKKNPKYIQECRNVLSILQTPREKQDEKIQSSDFLIDCARQLEFYLVGKTDFPQGEIQASEPMLIIKPLRKD